MMDLGRLICYSITVNTLRSSYNVRLIPEPSGEELSLGVAPGTVGADVIEHAGVAAMYEARNGERPLSPQQEWSIRNPFLSLRRANYKVLHDRSAKVSPIMFRGDAAAAALEGLVALQIEAHEARERLGGDVYLDKAKRREFEPAVEIKEERAETARIIEAELLDQALALGQSVVDAVHTAPS